MKHIKKILSLCLVLTIIIGVLKTSKVVKAAATDIGITDITVNYDSESVTVSSDYQANIIYFTDKIDSKNPSKTEWESVTTEAEGSKKTAVIDISWMKKSEVILYIKSDAEKATIYPIQLNAEEGTLKAYYSGIDTVLISKDTATITKLTPDNSFTAIDSGYVYFTIGKGDTLTQFTDLSKIEWKKGTTGKWYNYDTLTLNSYISKGAALYFRTKAVDSTTFTLKDDVYVTDGNRASKESKVTISRITREPSIKVNQKTYTLGLKSGMEYQVNNGDWIDVSQAHGDAKGKVSTITLFDLYTDYTSPDVNTKASYSSNTDFTVNVRIAANNKKVASKERAIILLSTGDAKELASLDDTDADNDLLTFSYKTDNDENSGLTITNGSKYSFDVAIIDKTDESIMTNNALDEEKIIKNKDIYWKTVKEATYNSEGTAVVNPRSTYIYNYKYEDILKENRIIIYRLSQINEDSKTEEIEFRVVSKAEQVSLPKVKNESVTQ